MILRFWLYVSIFLLFLMLFFMHDLVGTPRQENCFVIIIVVSMGNRYNSLLELPCLTMKISSFLSCIFFTLNMIYFSFIIKVGPSFFFVAYFSSLSFFHWVTFILKPFILFMVSIIFYFEVHVWPTVWKVLDFFWGIS